MTDHVMEDRGVPDAAERRATRRARRLRRRRTLAWAGLVLVTLAGAATVAPWLATGALVGLGVPTWWALVATRVRPFGTVSDAGWHPRRIAWYVVLLAGWAAGAMLPTPLAWVAVACAAVLATTTYLDWSRRFVFANGTSTVRLRPAGQRTTWYLAWLAVAALAVTGAAPGLVPAWAPGGLAGTFLATVLLVPLHLDAVVTTTDGDGVRAVPARRGTATWPLVAWTALLASVAVAVAVLADATTVATAARAGTTAVVGPALVAAWFELARRAATTRLEDAG